ncbi:MAG: alanine dehydrogenase [Saprospiraceae bacterium]|nr:alanine dehydrogenase [Saprospiraceae bacterium]
MKIGILREGKIPPDSRVPLTPQQCVRLIDEFQIPVFVQRSPNRCYSDREYLDAGIPLIDDVSFCDVLMGVKEVQVRDLLPDKIFMFFSHTIKKQPYNKHMLQTILARRITLIDYEVLTDEYNNRLIAFGHFAGMVGAYNGIWTYGNRTNSYTLKRMRDCRDYAEARAQYEGIRWPAMRIVVTGTGRVGTGAVQVLKDMGFHRVSPEDYLENTYQRPVFTQLAAEDYAAHQDDIPFNKNEYYTDPQRFHSIFRNYYQVSDIMINGIYWDPKAPAFFTREEMMQPDFRIQVIADISCDIAPEASVPCTLRASTIADPVYGYDPRTNRETQPYQTGSIDVMAIDNLPNELPRDASETFGNQFINHILPQFFNGDEGNVLKRATITRDGLLTENFWYLQEYVE